MKNLSKSLVLFIFLFCLSGCSFIRTFISGEPENFMGVEKENEVMNAAISQAQETLPVFIESFRQEKYDPSDCSIKVAIPYDSSGAAEHIWVDTLTYVDDHFEGVVANEPVYVKDLELGDTISVEIDSITDWMILSRTEFYGGYTIFALRSLMTEEERKEFDKETDNMFSGQPISPDMISNK